MPRPSLILMTILVILAIMQSGCGQKGPLFLPADPAAAQRATLTQTLRPGAEGQVAPALKGTTSSPSAP